MSDAVVIGAGHNGLLAVNLLLDAGSDVDVIEGEDTPGGAVRTRPVARRRAANDGGSTSPRRPPTTAAACTAVPVRTRREPPSVPGRPFALGAAAGAAGLWAASRRT